MEYEVHSIFNILYGPVSQFRRVSRLAPIPDHTGSGLAIPRAIIARVGASMSVEDGLIEPTALPSLAEMVSQSMAQPELSVMSKPAPKTLRNMWVPVNSIYLVAKAAVYGNFARIMRSECST